MNRNKIITIFGGSGFVGTNLVKKLVQENFIVQIIVQNIEKASHLKTISVSGFVRLIEWNFQDFAKFQAEIKNSFAVVYLIGLLYEQKKGDFAKFHYQIPAKISQICQEENIDRFIYLSALNVDKIAKSKYCNSKFCAEKEIIFQLKNKATILRPSIIFGSNDSFFNRFAHDLQKMPFIFLINNGKTQFKPIFVEDVNMVIVKIICNQVEQIEPQKQIYELSGSKTYSFKQLMKLTANYCNKKAIFINISFLTAKIIAFFLCIFNKKIITTDQVEIFKHDNVTNNQEFIHEFKIKPATLEEIVPAYLAKNFPSSQN